MRQFFCIWYISLPYLMFIFCYVSLQRSMIKLLWHYNFLNFISGHGIVLVSQGICTHTNPMHPTWPNGCIPRLCVSNVSMRHFLGLDLLDKLELGSNLKSCYFVFMQKMDVFAHCSYPACGQKRIVLML
jgi:hypothetical protein